MRVHHLNCGTMNPIWPRIKAVCYCLLLETNEGLVLVDAGLGTRDYLDPALPMRLFTALVRVPADPEETALRQIARLGFGREDVHHIVLTHLHLDHSGGLPDFPRARVHVYAAEHAAAMNPRGPLQRFGYVGAHWAHGPQWVLHTEDSTWFGFASACVLDRGSLQVRLIPLPGHTPGHCGVAIRTGDGWLFLCGDAVYPFYDPRWVEQCGLPPQWLIRLARANTYLAQLKDLWREHGEEVRFLFAHDALAFADARAG